MFQNGQLPTSKISTMFISLIPDTLQSVVDKLSSEQHFAYRICMAVMVGSLEEDLCFL